MLFALGKQERLDLGRELDLAMAVRISVDELRDLLAGSKRATLDSIATGELSRDTLKAIGAAIRVEAGGRGNKVLIEPVLEVATGPSNVKGSTRASGGNGALETQAHAQEWLSFPVLVPVHASPPLVSTAAAAPASNDLNEAEVPVDASQGVSES